MNCDNIFNRHVFIFSGIDTTSVSIVEALCSCGEYCYKNGTLEKRQNIYSGGHDE
mgnify:CR=1 FL=1